MYGATFQFYDATTGSAKTREPERNPAGSAPPI